MPAGQLVTESRSQHPSRSGGCGHRELLVLGQPEPVLPEVFQLCLGPMLKTVQSRNEKGEDTLTPPRDLTLLFQSTHFGGREGTILLFKTCQVETFAETLILLIKQEKTFVVKLMQLWNNRTN